MPMNRRDFLKLSATGVATLAIGSKLPLLGVRDAFASGQGLEIFITDALKDMVTHNSVNTAQCYFWVYRMRLDGQDIPVECPGPTIYAVKGDEITITRIKNDLDEPHSFVIPGIFDSGPIPPGQEVGPFTISVNKSGAHMYYDNLNEPVNRVMGLHGAMVVRPAAAANGHNFTPYDNPTTHVQNLYDAFGTSTFPGLKWEQGDQATNTPGFRHYVWLFHQASPNLFAEVGNYTPGQEYPAQQFMDKFLRDPFSPTRNNNKPQYYTINGQSGFFCHDSPAITPMSRVGEPVVIHVMNAGLQTHSMHMHCNHFFITSINGTVNPNPIWVDVYGIRPMDRIDYTFPFMRPPDNANVRGIGLPDQPLLTISGHPCWPPIDEMEVHIPPSFLPPPGTPGVPTDIQGNPLNMGQRLSPLCFPCHDHLEPSQTAQGGNYNCGAISGAYIIGDRNTPGFMDFPMDDDFRLMFRNIRGLAVNGANGTREAAGPRPVG